MASKTSNNGNHNVAQHIKTERVAVYARVSSEEQVATGTIANQLDFARRYCDLHSLTVFDYYKDDGVSGTIPLHERPEGVRLLRDAEAGSFGTVLVYKIDRMSRGNLRILLDADDRLKAAGVSLRSMTEPFDTSQPIGQFIMNLLGSLAQLERATILERMTLGKHRAAREGRWIGGTPPFGYRVEGPENHRKLAVHPDEAATVRRVFDLYVNRGMGLIPVCDLLNAEGVPTAFARRGQKTTRWPDQERRWSTGTVSRMLDNTAYVGRYRAGKRSGQEIAEYVMPAIVEQGIFNAAQRLLRERFVEASRNARRFYLLRGLITCHCGRSVIGDGHRNPAKYYYSCTRSRGHFHERAEVLEEQVWQDVAGFAREPGPTLAKLREQMRAQLQEGAGSATELAEVVRGIAGKKAEEDGVITLYRKGRITESQLDGQLDALDAEIATLEGRQQALFARQEQAQANEVALLSASSLLAQLRNRVGQIEADVGSDDEDRRVMALEAKRDLIKGLTVTMKVAEDGSLRITYRFAPTVSDSSVQTST